MPISKDRNDLILVVDEFLRRVPFSAEESIGLKMVDFATFIENQSSGNMLDPIEVSIRELLSWAHFIISLAPKNVTQLYESYFHGAHLAILDGLGAGLSVSRTTVEVLRSSSLNYLLQQCPPDLTSNYSAALRDPINLHINDLNVRVGPFSISREPTICNNQQYVLNSPVTKRNMLRLLRAMQIARPILLEGPPGVGKSSVIACLAEITGRKLVRINLSEHTELADLLGSDLPCMENSDGSQIKFQWVDGVFLTALKRGDWVLLDELNLAPQAVLEGEVY